MTAHDLFRTGRLRAATDAQAATVDARPADPAARFFLFELVLFTGDLDRARRQLDALTCDDPRHTATADRYRHALDAEATRRAVFAGTDRPKGLATAPDHVGLRVEALACLARGDHAEARRLLTEANAAAPAVRGVLDGEPVDGLCDADERLGTVLEVFGPGGVYSWVPLERVAGLTLGPPVHPRDVVFRPARLVLRDGAAGDVLLPGLYPGTHDHPDEAVRLGRATEWTDAPGEVPRGAGGRLFLSGPAAIEFARWRTLTTH